MVEPTQGPKNRFEHSSELAGGTWYRSNDWARDDAGLHTNQATSMAFHPSIVNSPMRICIVRNGKGGCHSCGPRAAVTALTESAPSHQLRNLKSIEDPDDAARGTKADWGHLNAFATTRAEPTVTRWPAAIQIEVSSSHGNASHRDLDRWWRRPWAQRCHSVGGKIRRRDSALASHRDRRFVQRIARGTPADR